MAGNRSVFNDAIRKANNHAWDGQWAKAIVEYRRALTEFPDDLVTHMSLAHVLEGAGQAENALQECRAAAKLQPNDPAPLARAAALQEKLRRPSEAAGTWLSIAEIHMAKGAVDEAVKAWQKAAALEPDRADVHVRLAGVFEQGGKRPLAAKEYVCLAQILQRRGEKAKAREHIRKAVALDPDDATARALCDELDRGEPADQASVPSPVDQAEQAALSRLAETLLEEKPSWARVEASEASAPAEARPLVSQAEIDALIARAVDAQTKHRPGDAIECYGKLVAAGISRPEVKFNLGLLYLETMRYDDAVKLLQETVHNPDYALASHFALGQCFRALGHVDAAVEQFLQVTKIVDLGSVRRDQADELISVYEGLAESYTAKGDREQAEAFSRSLEDFLTNKGWEDKVREVRQHLELLRDEEGQVSLAEVIGVAESDKVLEALAISQDYVRRGKYAAAGDACFRAIELAPNYVPSHVRLAEILIKENRIEEAKVKYQILAELAVVRGELSRAERYYRRLVKISSDDVANRSKLIDILIQQEHVGSALDEYLEFGDGYSRSGQHDKAAEKFVEGVRLATRSNVKSTTAAKLRHRLAEARAAQGDVRAALAVYQEIRQQSPEDERARVFLVELEFRLGQTAAAARDLTELLQWFRSRGQTKKCNAVLEGLVSSHPNDMSLREQLAQNYVQAGDKEKALAALDALGELQLTAGQKRAAAATVRKIISMNPPRVEDYKQLLRQIGE